MERVGDRGDRETLMQQTHLLQAEPLLMTSSIYSLILVIFSLCLFCVPGGEEVQAGPRGLWDLSSWTRD